MIVTAVTTSVAASRTAALRAAVRDSGRVLVAAAAETTRAALAGDGPSHVAPEAGGVDHPDAPCADGCDVLGSGHTVGGQAVIEGVMMRGRRSWGLAVRQPSGVIAHHSFALTSVAERHPVLKLPILRGIVTLVESLVLGMRALGLSANLSLEGDEEAAGTDGVASDAPASGPGSTDGAAAAGLGWKEMAVTFVIALGLAVVLFVVIPLAVVKYFEHVFSNPFVFNLVEGLIRIAIFLAYVGLISLIPDLRRVFEYHGAEHKVIHAYEAGYELDTENAGRFTTLHPRCGTAFLLVVMVMAILVFSVVGKPSLVLLVLSRLVGIPIVAGLSYEVIRFAGRHKDGVISRVVLWPGLKLQRLTTREPSVEQVEVAIVALVEVLRVDAGGEPDPRGLVAAGAR